MNYALEDYKNLIKSNEIYSNSYKAFSEFNNDSFSKLIFIDSYKDKIADKITHADFDFMFDSELPTENDRLNDWKRKIELFEFDFNEEMYDVKMKSQLKYYEKVIFEARL